MDSSNLFGIAKTSWASASCGRVGRGRHIDGFLQMVALGETRRRTSKIADSQQYPSEHALKTSHNGDAVSVCNRRNALYGRWNRCGAPGLIAFSLEYASAVNDSRLAASGAKEKKEYR